MHPHFNFNTIAHHDLPIRLSTLPAFSESEAQPEGEERVFIGTGNIVSAGAR